MRALSLVCALGLGAVGCGGGGSVPVDEGTGAPDLIVVAPLPDLASAPVDLATRPDLSPPGPDLTVTAPDEPWSCVSDGGVVTPIGAGDGGYQVQTDHYLLHLEVPTAARAAELGHIAEAAWQGFASYFSATPMVAPGERLHVGYFADHDRWAAALQADGVPVPSAGGIYWTGTKTAYLFAQPTLYFTDMLFIHEMSHQFHYLARTGNQGLAFPWYVEGMAEYISRHDWDGQCLRLGRMPTLTQEDYPKQALADMQKTTLDLATFITGMTTGGRDEDLMVYRYFERARAGAYRPGWKMFRDAMDAGAMNPFVPFANFLGDPDVLVGDFDVWVQTEQEPMSVVWLEWTHLVPGSVRATSPGAFSAALVKQSVALFEASWQSRGAGDSGVVTRFQDSSNYTAWMVRSDGTVRRYEGSAGKLVYTDMGKVVIPGDGIVHAAVDFTQTPVQVTLAGTNFPDPSAMTAAAGLAVYQSVTRFDGIAFR